MSELSPAAFAVVNAFVCAHARKSDPSSNADIAAALRAVADQGEMLFDEYDDPIQAITVENLLAIAKELETQ